MTRKPARDLGRGNKVADNMFNAEVKLLGSLSTMVVIYCGSRRVGRALTLNDPTSVGS
jgi:hypothetical protein